MNLPSQATQKLKEKFEKAASKDLFDDILVQVKVNLKDTFYRFSKNPEYQQLKEQMIIEREMMKQTGIDNTENNSTPL